VVSAARAIELEPALAPLKHRLTGGTYTEEDESGDAQKFTQALAERCKQAGVVFKHNTEVVGFQRGIGRVDAVDTLVCGHHDSLRADAWVLSMGSFSAPLARQLGLSLNIYPAKGYSITVPVKNPGAAFNVSLTDDEYKLVYSRLGDRMRIAGTAEFSGYSRRLNVTRCQAVLRRVAAVMPEAGHWEHAEYWSGLRPATPSSVPYVGKSAISNLFLNTGHGTLGWTHACGSAAALADIIAGRPPQLDFRFSGA
jgi:D-amino-acid dehydrogenase